MEMYSDNLIERQRKIGKQLMLVNMIHVENEKELNGQFVSQLPIETLSEWSLMDEDEIDELIEATHCLYEQLLVQDFVYELSSCNRDHHVDHRIFLEDTILDHGSKVLSNYNEVYITDYSIREAKTNYYKLQNKYAKINVSKEFATPQRFRETLEHYVKYVVHLIGEVVSKGYDWAVIKEMLGYDLTEEKYEELVALFGHVVENDVSKEPSL